MDYKDREKIEKIIQDRKIVHEIKEIMNDSEIKDSVQVIRGSFITVAKDFNLNEKNCPTNPAFITFEKLKALKEKGVKLFGLFKSNRQIGFVAIEKASDKLYYVEKLAVLPEYRHKGYGKKLMAFVFDYVRRENGKRLSIAIIDENSILKNWYKSYGFVETGTEKFAHLPFTVCFLEKEVC